jgi:hypothetical protein
VNDFERQTLRDLIDDERASGVDGIDLSIIVYSYAFNHFRPALKSEIDIVLGSKGLPTLQDNDPRLASQAAVTHVDNLPGPTTTNDARRYAIEAFAAVVAREKEF